MLVSGVETVWNGVEIPPYASIARSRRDWRGRGIIASSASPRWRASTWARR
jgi:hypothetical protein